MTMTLFDRSRRSLAALLAALLAAALIAGAAGCIERSGSDASSAAGTVAVAGAAQGPDSTSGFGTKSVTRTGLTTFALDGSLPDDFGIASSGITVNIDAVGLDPSSIIPGKFPTGVPIQNTLAPSGGNMVDIAIAGVPNDQFLTNGMGVVGFADVGKGAATFQPPDNLVFWFEVIPDTDPAAAAFGAAFDGASNLRRVVCRGVLLNTTSRTAAGAAIGGTTTEAASDIKANATSSIPASFLANVPDAMSILVHTAGGSTVPIPELATLSSGTTTHIPVFVTQIYTVDLSTRYLNVTTIIVRPDSSFDILNIGGAAELVGIGATSNKNLDVLPGGPVFIPVPAPLALLFPGKASVHTAEYNATLAGTPYAAYALPGDNFGAGVVPWMSLIGRDEPGVSYTYYDPGAGGMVFQRIPGAFSTVPVLVQLRSQKTIASADPLAGGLYWLRSIAVGGANDAASSADPAIRALPSFPVRTVGSAQFVTSDFTLHGRVRNMPEGTVVTISEQKPTFFSFFNPLTETPTSAIRTPVFAGPYLANATGTANITLTAAVLRTTVRPGADGRWAVTLPDGFFAQPTSTATIDVPFSIYEARALMPGGAAPVALGTVTATRGVGEIDLGTVDLTTASDFGYLTYRIEDVDHPGTLIPGMITILTFNGATLTADLSIPTGLEEGWERAFLAGNLITSASGEGTVPLRAGTYGLRASAGIEWETDPLSPATPLSFDIVKGIVKPLSFQLKRVTNVVRTAISADFHVHSGQSSDSSVPGADRVRSFLAQGVEILASTEHDKVGDLSAGMAAVANERPDIGNRLHLVSGDEATPDLGWIPPANPAATPQVIGHWNAFPLPFDPSLRKKGAPEDEIRPPAVLFADFRLLQASAGIAGIIQMNHPRSTTSTSAINGGDAFLTNMAFAFGPAFGTDTGGTLAITPPAIQVLVGGTTPFGATLGALLQGTASFDTYEVLNGVQDIGRYLQNRADWFAFLNRGVVKTAVGDSDTHRIANRSSFGDFSHVALPRNYVLLGSKTPAAVSDADIVGAMKPTFETPTPSTTALVLNPAPFAGNAMKSFFTTGPFVSLEVTLDGTTVTDPIGKFIDATGAGDVTITATITGPTWVMDEVSEVKIWVNGVVSGSVSPTGGVATFPTTLPNDQDTWIVVEVGPASPAANSIFAEVYPGTSVVALTNPIFFNRDADATTFDALNN